MSGETVDVEVTRDGAGAADGIAWNGVDRAYKPADDWQAPERPVLHTEAVEVDDPITFEVIRHNLWNINAEHFETIKNLSVSNITVECRDYQTVICAEDGEILFFGLGVQYFAGWMDLVIKYILENHGDDIAAGDMWLVNDPWIGTAHQPDVNLVCPVFVEDELFCWVANSVHQNDVGGTVPGSFCPNAQDIYFDPPLFPPCRIVRNDQIDPELESIYRRQSRTPVNLALDLRAAVAGNHAARERTVHLVKKYGAGVVKGVMRGLLDNSEDAFRELLRTIPDGDWEERVYQEVAVSGDRGIYPIGLQMRKVGDVLSFTNAGTDPQVGAINLPFAAWRGTIMAVFNYVALADQMGVVGGAARLMRFEPTPGTITCPDYGAAVSPSGIYATEIGVSMANSVVSKMLMCSSDPRIRSWALTPAPGQWQLNIHAGMNQRDTFYVGAMQDGLTGMSGATPNADGVFANGTFFAPAASGPNVETYERDWPMLYLYRRQDPSSGGAGRYRGGNGGRLAYIPYGGQMELAVYTSEGLSKNVGLMGGSPGAVGETHYRRASSVLQDLAAGKMPERLDQLGGDPVQTYGKGESLPVAPEDAIEWNWSGSGGFGDPLTRDPDLVLADFGADLITEAAVGEDYGVVLDKDVVDVAATLALRAERRRERLAAAGLEVEVPVELEQEIPEGAQAIAHDIWVDREAACYRCARCGAKTGSADAHSTSELIAREMPLPELSSRYPDPRIWVDAEAVWREFYCRGCGTRLAGEIARPEEAPVVGCRLDLS